MNKNKWRGTERRLLLRFPCLCPRGIQTRALCRSHGSEGAAQDSAGGQLVQVQGPVQRGPGLESPA